MKDEENTAEQQAKQAISPAGLSDRSDRGNSRPASETPLKDAPPSELEEKYVEGENDEPGANIHQRHPNRNADDKPELDKPAYS